MDKRQLDDILNLTKVKIFPGPIQLQRIWRKAEARWEEYEGYDDPDNNQRAASYETICFLCRALWAARNLNKNIPKLIAEIEEASPCVD